MRISMIMKGNMAGTHAGGRAGGREGAGRPHQLALLRGSRPLEMSVNERERRARGPTPAKSHRLLTKPTKEQAYHRGVWTNLRRRSLLSPHSLAADVSALICLFCLNFIH